MYNLMKNKQYYHHVLPFILSMVANKYG